MPSAPKSLRDEMVARQLRARGIRDADVLEAMHTVPREEFVTPALVEFAYDDAPLPIDEQQTISQPYIVALMTEALELSSDDRVLEIGTGSGYAAAVLGEIASEVYTVERHRALAESARSTLTRLGYGNVHVRCGDGTHGWAEHAPYDAIVVAAGGPEVPAPLKEQLAVGGRLVIPVGPSPRLQNLVRVRRESDTAFVREDLGDVRFVPLIGAQGWVDEAEEQERVRAARRPAAEQEAGPETLADIVARTAEPFGEIAGADLDDLLDRIGDARVICLGEATHGTAEFYQMRARITRALIERAGVRIVAAEADWPDARRVNRYVQGGEHGAHPERAFTRFPTWMWANLQVLDFVDWLRGWNDTRGPADRTGFYGLDLYSLHTSIGAVLRYLDDVDPEAAGVARARYGCLSPWERDPAAYGAAALRGRFRGCEKEVVAMLVDLLRKRGAYEAADGERFFDAARNAQVVTAAERYYRAMYYGARASWNLRDQHMFDTLEALLAREGPESRAVLWAHNSHLGDASATEMGARGEHNLGMLCRRRFGEDAYLVGFGTDHGTVAAAHDWDGPMEVMEVRAAHARSYEAVCHQTRLPAFLLPLRAPSSRDARRALATERLERAIGVLYRPRTELQSHYFYASLPAQFDEWIWFDETQAVDPLTADVAPARVPETFPFGV